jgi:hypothetical protein
MVSEKQDRPKVLKYALVKRVFFTRETQAEFLDKGKPVARPGRKAMGPPGIARPPKEPFLSRVLGPFGSFK